MVLMRVITSLLHCRLFCVPLTAYAENPPLYHLQKSYIYALYLRKSDDKVVGGEEVERITRGPSSDHGLAPVLRGPPQRRPTATILLLRVDFDLARREQQLDHGPVPVPRSPRAYRDRIESALIRESIRRIRERQGTIIQSLLLSGQ